MGMKTEDISDKAVCLAAKEYWRGAGTDTPTILMGMFNCPEKIAYSAMNRALRRDLIDFGVSLRCCWLTKKGEELIL